MKSLRNGVLVEMTAEEVSAREAEIASLAEANTTKANAKEEARVAQEAADAEKATNKANAKAKLKAAEYTHLTEDEADAVVI